MRARPSPSPAARGRSGLGELAEHHDPHLRVRLAKRRPPPGGPRRCPGGGMRMSVTTTSGLPSSIARQQRVAIAAGRDVPQSDRPPSSTCATRLAHEIAVVREHDADGALRGHAAGLWRAAPHRERAGHPRAHMPQDRVGVPLPGIPRRGTVSQRREAQRAQPGDGTGGRRSGRLPPDARSLIAATPGFEQVGEAASGAGGSGASRGTAPGPPAPRRPDAGDGRARDGAAALGDRPERRRRADLARPGPGAASVDRLGRRTRLTSASRSSRRGRLRAVWEAHSAAHGETHSRV